MPYFGIWGRRIAYSEIRRSVGEPLGQIASDAPVGEDALNRYADLPGVVEPTLGDKR